jgi:hypothetical protein
MGRLFWVATLTAVVATGVALFLLNRPSQAAPASTEPTLVLGTPYDGNLRAASRVEITFPPASLPQGTRVDLLGVGNGGSVVAEGSLAPSPNELASGAVGGVVPGAAEKPAYWIALAPVGRTRPIVLQIAPQGPQPAGTPLAAILKHVPAGTDVYLLGLLPAQSGTPPAVAYVPPRDCVPNPPSAGMTICNFRAPPGYNNTPISFVAFSTDDTVTSLPAGTLPEVAWPAALPVIGLACALFLRIRSRTTSS